MKPTNKLSSRRRAQNDSVCALVSGGFDSTVMLAELARRWRYVQPVYIQEGLTWEPAELKHLRLFIRALSDRQHSSIKPLKVLNLPVGDLFSGHWSLTGQRAPDASTPDEAMYLPGRNLLLLSKAAVYCSQRNIPVLAVGSLHHNPFPDASTKFLRDFGRVAGTALGCNLRVIAPFRHLTKAQVVRRAAKLGIPMHLSFSCVAPQQGRHCGRCNKCAERQRAFAQAGVNDMTRYAMSGA
jgi:7-cyano-7-deazaguanine synthase